MIRKLGIFLAGSFLIWALAAFPAWYWWGSDAVLLASAACGLCLVPMLATLVWSSWALKDPAPETQLAAVFGGTGLRMAIVLVGGALLYSQVEFFHRTSFMLLVVFFYLATLALEVGLVLWNTKPSDG